MDGRMDGMEWDGMNGWDGMGWMDGWMDGSDGMNRCIDGWDEMGWI